ncbi:MAG: energy-coupling factor ABC transporter permease [Bacillota bacterium]|nr:energy-coupling factor ABC transporter permease [Bacillota bacterium]
MHMADALISPAVGGVMWAASAGMAAYSIKKIQPDMDKKKIPLMGVLGAFVFTAQMINFSIPGTGSSGHLGGGVLLSALLGPYAGFLTMASILIIQALFFADGGLLALGCNIFNLGFFACFITYPLIYRLIIRKGYSGKKIFFASLASSVVALQLGAFFVVLETLLSGKTELPFGTFAMLMQPIHLAIGVVEGLITSAILAFVWRAQPDLLEKTEPGKPIGSIPIKKIVIFFIAAAMITGGVLSWFASTNPDGLEWSMGKVSGKTEIAAVGGIYDSMSQAQESTAFFPDYGFKDAGESAGETGKKPAAWPAALGETSVSGLVGGAMVLVLTGLTGLVIGFVKRKKKKPERSATGSP